MQINLNLDLEKLRQKQRQKTKTGLSMQATVNGALNLPVQNPYKQQNNNQSGVYQNPTKSNGWGSNVQ